MFIGICGSICSGKSTVAEYLVEHHGFRRLKIEPVLPSIEDDASLPSTAVGANSTAATSGSQKSVQPNGIQGHNHMTSPRGHHQRLAVRTSRQAISFCTAEELVDFVTKSWQDRWVTTDLPSEAVLDIYSRRPFFLLISVDAPLTVRWQRFQQRQEQGAHPGRPAVDGEASITTLDDFVRRCDAHLYDPATGHLPLMSRASVRLLNTSSSLAHLYATLGKVDLLNEDRLRPSWDTYFMALASLAARRSNCMKRRVGCVLVRQRRVVSTGYNGTPRGLRNCGEGGCARCNDGLGSGHGLATCLCIHAEENALLEAGRERIREGATLYCDTCPCLTCSIKIAQVGIGEVVYSQGYSMDGDTAAVFREAGVKLRQFVPPANGLIHLEKMELYN